MSKECTATRSDPRFANIHRCIFRNAMFDVRAALRGLRTKREQNIPGGHDGTMHFRSHRRTNTETIRLDAAVFRPDDPQGLRPPKDTGPMRFVERCEPATNPHPANGSSHCPNRIRAAVHFGCNLREVSPFIVRDRRWLIDRLVSERYLRHEAKLLCPRWRAAVRPQHAGRVVGTSDWVPCI